MIYLKIIFSSPAEIKFLKLNFRESYNYVDKFIVCEFNRTHMGAKRNLIFKRYKNDFTENEKNKIIYIGADISKEIVMANNSNQAHKNEQLIRGYFIKKINLNNNDIIVSVDADEIIFSGEYKNILNCLGFFTKAIKLELYQFFYKINYLWEYKKFIAPTVCYVKYYKNKFPSQWRYDGKLYKKNVGCHFSWCLKVEDMIKKLNIYSHHYDYGQFAKKEILENAIKNKKYPFDPKIDFNIKVLNIYKNKEYYPKSIYSILDEFEDLID